MTIIHSYVFPAETQKLFPDNAPCLVVPRSHRDPRNQGLVPGTVPRNSTTIPRNHQFQNRALGDLRLGRCLCKCRIVKGRAGKDRTTKVIEQGGRDADRIENLSSVPMMGRLDRLSSTAACSRKDRNGGEPFWDREMRFGHAQGGVEGSGRRTGRGLI